MLHVSISLAFFFASVGCHSALFSITWGVCRHHPDVSHHSSRHQSVLLGDGVGPLQCREMEAQSWVPQQMVQWDTPMARWTGEGKDWVQLMTQTQLRKEDVIRNLLESMKQPADKKKESEGSVLDKEIKGYCLDLGTPVPGESPTLEIKGDNKTIVDWNERPHQDENENWHSGEGTKPPTGMVGSRDALTAANHRLGSPTPFVNTTKKLTSGQERARRGVQRNAWIPPAVRGERLPVYVDSGMEALDNGSCR